MRYNIIFGGPAGSGPNFLTNFIGAALVNKGYSVFYSRDYQSLIRGGHNFNVLTFSDEDVYSNDAKADILVALDEKTEEIHKKEVVKGVVLKGQKENMYYAGAIFKLLGFSAQDLENEIKALKKRVEDNLKNAQQGFEEEKRKICDLKENKNKGVFLSGSEGIAQGAVKSGMDLYYAYPMTPATPVLGALAKKQEKENYVVVKLENEIAVALGAIGSAMTGAKTMVGTSGGGFDLMTECLSLVGMAKVPLVMYLAQRPGPASGVPTYNIQGDLNMARHSGHGEFPRIVIAPGDPNECQAKVNEAFYFSQKYKVPVIVLSDKHLAESYFTQKTKPKIMKSPKQTSFGRYNSYECGENGSAIDDPEGVKKNMDYRLKTTEAIEKEAGKFEQYKIYGNKDSKNLIVGWGSTKGAILDAIKDLDVGFLQILYMEPFPDVRGILEGKNLILIENNSTAQLGQLIREKLLMDIETKILRYDVRPFLADELKLEIEKNLK